VRRARFESAGSLINTVRDSKFGHFRGHCPTSIQYETLTWLESARRELSRFDLAVAAPSRANQTEVESKELSMGRVDRKLSRSAALVFEREQKWRETQRRKEEAAREERVNVASRL